jgi:HSP20 family protein
MAESEVKVKTSAPENAGTVTKRPEFEMPLFGSEWFQMNPFALMRKLAREMDRGFHTVLENSTWSPVVEIKEAAGMFRVIAELPGVDAENVKVRVTEDAVVLEGERKREKEEKREGFYRSERSYGSFYRALPLPKGADPDKASAAFSNGVLEIVVPVSASKANSREVPIKHAA